MVPGITCDDPDGHDGAGIERSGAGFDPVDLRSTGMSILKKMSDFLAGAGRFSVTIRDGYEVVQESGQKIEFGELRNVTVSRPDQLRIEVERSDGQKGTHRRPATSTGP